MYIAEDLFEDLKDDSIDWDTGHASPTPVGAGADPVITGGEKSGDKEEKPFPWLAVAAGVAGIYFLTK